MGLSKVTIIATPTKEPRAVIQPSFDVVAVFAPTLLIIIQCQQLLGAASLSCYSQAHWLTWQFFRLGWIIASQLYVASSFFRARIMALGRIIWETKTIQRLKKRIVFEFFTLMLGSGGNCMCLIVFWPGWWVLGLIGLAVRFCYG
ncbi:hypothetical protein F5Y13DRAFT_179229 [Hypoxylon sp. FL1857]|nr:hypothetical protein F5Y13DRAFT_179229 [Hypoxylon sp. FL1857]